MKKIKVGSIDDHPLIAKGLSTVLGSSDRVELVLTAIDSRELFRKLRRRKIDVLLVDLSLKNEGGFDVMERLRAEYPLVRMIVHSVHQGSWHVNRAVEHGAKGYVTKDSSAKTLEPAIVAVGQGGFFFSNGIREGLYGHIGSSKTNANNGQPLTDVQIRLLRMLAQGMSTYEIATSLSRSPRTIDTHREQLLRKFNAKNSTQLVAEVMTGGLI